MVQKTIMTIHDDLDGRELDADGKTITFALEGRQYEIDLHSDNLRIFRETVAAYTEHARTVPSRAATKPAEAAPAKVDSKSVRAWAQSRGISLSPRGRISAEIVEQYRIATG